MWERLQKRRTDGETPRAFAAPQPGQKTKESDAKAMKINAMPMPTTEEPQPSGQDQTKVKMGDGQGAPAKVMAPGGAMDQAEPVTKKPRSAECGTPGLEKKVAERVAATDLPDEL